MYCVQLFSEFRFAMVSKDSIFKVRKILFRSDYFCHSVAFSVNFFADYDKNTNHATYDCFHTCLAMGVT